MSQFVPAVQPVTAGDHDLLPYRSIPFPETQPDHMSALAQMFGLVPPACAQAKVLELGCASGGNLIPMALRFPQATFTGIDLSATHVAQAQAQIRALGLRNIEIRQADIETLDLGAARYDYILCHGVYSWVPESVQGAIFQIADNHLSETGLLYVSYNTYPGWHLRNTVRDICSYSAGTAGGPADRVAKARLALNKMAQMCSDQTPYGQMLTNEARLNEALPDSYILGEFLADQNRPCYFHEFVAAAARHDLVFLTETDLPRSIPENLGPEQAQALREIAGDNRLQIEQYMDFLSGRQFRRSVLMRASALGQGARRLSPDHMARLYIVSDWQRDCDNPDGSVTFKRADQTLRARGGDTIRMMDFLARSAPATVSVEALLRYLSTPRTQMPKKAETKLLQLLFRLTREGRLTVRSCPLDLGRATDSHPCVSSLARLQMRDGQDWVSSLNHRLVRVPQSLYGLLCRMDGTRTRAELIGQTAAALRPPTGAETAPVDPQAEAADIVSRTLAMLESQALLCP